MYKVCLDHLHISIDFLEDSISQFVEGPARKMIKFYHLWSNERGIGGLGIGANHLVGEETHVHKIFSDDSYVSGKTKPTSDLKRCFEMIVNRQTQ
jgi:hypothetical protein